MSIKLDLKIFLFLVIFFITRQIKIYAFLMLFAFIHECAHICTGIIFGLKPKELNINPCGFSVNFFINCDYYNKKIKKANLVALKKIVIALAGPIVNLLIAIYAYVYYTISKNTTILSMDLEMIIYSNILLFIFNMLPIYPLDGGRIIKGIVAILKGRKWSYVAINKISNLSIILLTAIASIGVLFYKNIAIIIVLIYLWMIVIYENRIYKNKQKILENIYCKNNK